MTFEMSPSDVKKKKKALSLHNERLVLELQNVRVRDVQGLNSVTPSQIKAQREVWGKWQML